MEDTSNFVPKVVEQEELRLLIKDQARVIQALQEGMATQSEEIAMITGAIQALQEDAAKTKAAHAEKIAMLTAAIQEDYNKARRLGLPQDNAGNIEAVNTTVQAFVADISTVNATVQKNAASINAVSSIVQALETKLEDAIEDLSTSISGANACCANTTAALIRSDVDGDGVSDLEDGCPNNVNLFSFGDSLNDTSQCETLSPSLSPTVGPSVSLAPTTICQGSISTDPSTGSK